MSIGTLIKTETIHGFFIGLVKNHLYEDKTDEIVIGVTWNDCDETTERFHEYEEYDTTEYFFYHKGRWWEIHHNFYKFKQVLEGQ